MARRRVDPEVQARRGKTYAFTAHTRRSENVRAQRAVVIIALEDEKSSRDYFEALFRELLDAGKIARSSFILVPHEHTDPVGVFRDLKTFRHFGMTYKDYEYRWIVIDRDKERAPGEGHSLESFNEALRLAAADNCRINVAWANPCFEIWYLLHFHYHCTGIERGKPLEDKLSHCLGSNYNKSDKSMYERLKDLQPTAIRHALNLENESKDIPLADRNPGTTVHTLVQILNNLGQ